MSEDDKAQGSPKTAAGWETHVRPAYMFRRFEFSAYHETRDFLDRLGKLSEETGCYPDISFGTGYANITIHARDDAEVSDEDVAFAKQVSDLAQTKD